MNYHLPWARQYEEKNFPLPVMFVERGTLQTSEIAWIHKRVFRRRYCVFCLIHWFFSPEIASPEVCSHALHEWFTQNHFSTLLFNDMGVLWLVPYLKKSNSIYFAAYIHNLLLCVTTLPSAFGNRGRSLLPWSDGRSCRTNKVNAIIMEGFDFAGWNLTSLH